jgi:hypothetical protein
LRRHSKKPPRTLRSKWAEVPEAGEVEQGFSKRPSPPLRKMGDETKKMKKHLPGQFFLQGEKWWPKEMPHVQQK